MIVLGDIHGDYKPLFKLLKRHDIKNTNIVQIGDFGYSFAFSAIQTEKEYLKSLKYFNKVLKSKNCTLYAIRGNHDNPIYFNNELKFSNLIFVKDYSVIKIEDKNCLFIGGAISIDRTLRAVDKSYWKDEEFVYDKDKINNIKENIDIVFTHTKPSFINRIADTYKSEFFIKMLAEDSYLKTDLLIEQNKLDNLYNDLINNNHKITNWFYGHYHQYYREYYNEIKFECVDINQLIDISK